METFLRGDGEGVLTLLRSYPTHREAASAVLSFAESMGEEPFRAKVALLLSSMAGATDIIPEAYGTFRRMFAEGLVFFLGRLSLPRLAAILAYLSRTEEETPSARLIELAKQIPTLHKLGQMLARNPHMDPKVRSWLVSLEHGDYGTDAAGVRREIAQDLGPDMDRYGIRLGEFLLAEASVGAVLPFTWTDPGTGLEKTGVFKALKPKVSDQLAEEGEILDALGRYYDTHGERYGFAAFPFADLFKDVKTALLEELNLSGEQVNLSEASDFFRGNREVRIPEVAPFSSPSFTAMTFMIGTRVTDALVHPEDRSTAAEILFRALICDPLFSRLENPLFHGDPHAGNIFSNAPGDQGLSFSLLDWCQAGHLPKAFRVEILKFIQGVLREDMEMILAALEQLSQPGEETIADIREEIPKIMALAEYQADSRMKRAFFLLDRLVRLGIRLPKDILLFRKSFFTLDGLLKDLDPDFSADRVMMRYVRDLLVKELPRRVAALLVPVWDTAEQYRSLMSNRDLQVLLLSQAMTLITRGARHAAAFLERQEGLLLEFLKFHGTCAAKTAILLLGVYYMYRMPDPVAEV